VKENSLNENKQKPFSEVTSTIPQEPAPREEGEIVEGNENEPMNTEIDNQIVNMPKGNGATGIPIGSEAVKIPEGNEVTDIPRDNEAMNISRDNEVMVVPRDNVNILKEDNDLPSTQNVAGDTSSKLSNQDTHAGGEVEQAFS